MRYVINGVGMVLTLLKLLLKSKINLFKNSKDAICKVIKQNKDKSLFNCLLAKEGIQVKFEDLS